MKRIIDDSGIRQHLGDRNGLAFAVMPGEGLVGRQRQDADRRTVPGGRPDHRFGDRRIAPPAPDGIRSVYPLHDLAVGFGRRPHETRVLVRHRPPLLIDHRRGADIAARTNVNAIGRQRDQRAGRSGLVVDPHPYRNPGIEQHRADRIGRRDDSAVRIHLDNHQVGSHLVRLREAFPGQPFDRRHDVFADREGIDQLPPRRIGRAPGKRPEQQRQNDPDVFHPVCSHRHEDCKVHISDTPKAISSTGKTGT